MAPPEPRINTFFKNTEKPTVDSVSKTFLIAGILLGVNRLEIIKTTRTLYYILIQCYSIFLNLLLCALTIYRIFGPVYLHFVMIINGLQFHVGTILTFAFRKRLSKFYLNLYKLDKEIGMKKAEYCIRNTVYNFFQIIVTIITTITLYCLAGDVKSQYIRTSHAIPSKLLYFIEMHYYGHLISLLIPRLKAINEFTKFSYPNRRDVWKTTDSRIEGEDRTSELNTKKLLVFYNKLIIAYDSLYDAVKWQMLTLLITTFSITLCLLYEIAKAVISGNVEIQGIILRNISIVLIQLFPFVVPCVFADHVQKEVRQIKDFVACKLYENTLDKPSRRTTRTLLALMETRNLTFSLFHMFDIDISLPFKILALLLTYLIIFLQFDKIISPEGTAYISQESSN